MILADGIIGQMMEPVSFEDIKPGEILLNPWATTRGQREGAEYNKFPVPGSGGTGGT